MYPKTELKVKDPFMEMSNQWDCTEIIGNGKDSDVLVIRPISILYHK